MPKFALTKRCYIKKHIGANFGYYYFKTKNMHFSKIKVTREYQYNGISTWIHAEVSLNEGEDPKSAIKASNNLCDESWAEISAGQVVPEIQVDRDLSPEEKIIKAMESCSTIDELETFDLITKNNPSLRQLYTVMHVRLRP